MTDRACLCARKNPPLRPFLSSFFLTFALMQSDEHWMRMALAEARQAADEGEVPIGAVIVADDCIIGSGHNRTEALADVTAHAEMIAITSASERLGGKYLNACTLYVTVEPCTMCAGALGWSQIGRVVFGTSDPKRGYQLFAPRALHPRCYVTAGILGDECAELLRAFFKERRPANSSKKSDTSARQHG